jgi:hypothetical protein
LAATAVAQPPYSLPDGWGPYKFDDSKSDVISKSGRVLLPARGGGPDLFDSTRINGQLYTVDLSFRGFNPKLYRIELHAELGLGKMDKDGCISFFKKLAGDLKQKYGEMEFKTEKVPLRGQISSYQKKVGDATLNISENFTDRCDVNVRYEAPPLQPYEGSF